MAPIAAPQPRYQAGFGSSHPKDDADQVQQTSGGDEAGGISPSFGVRTDLGSMCMAVEQCEQADQAQGSELRQADLARH